MTKPLLDHALALAEQGFYVFPIAVGKKSPPAWVNWQEKATRDPEFIRETWTDRAFNIGIFTGKFGDGEALLVIDVDIKNGKRGDHELLRHELEGRVLPGTYSVHTPTGGRHHYYRVSAPVRQGTDILGRGVDVRSAGGYVVAAGSRVGGGEYVADTAAVACAPAWVVDQCGAVREREAGRSLGDTHVSAPSAIDRATHYLQHEAPVAVEGESGDQTTFKVAARLKDFGVTPEQAVDLMAEHWNDRCIPSWPLQELREKVANAWNYGSQPPGAAAPELAFPPIEPAPSIIDFVDFGKLAYGPPPPREWFWDGWMPRKAVTALFGRGGHGKSLFAQQLCTAAEQGGMFLGHTILQGPSLGIFCEDDPDELLRRGADIFADMFQDVKGVGKALHLDARAGKPNTLVAFTMDHRPVPTLLMRHLRDQCERIKPALVVLDNIAQIFAGQENFRGEVTAFCNELTGIARDYDCAVLLLGHLAKAEGSEFSGSTAWDAAVRSRLLLDRGDDGTTVLRKLKANYSGLDEMRLEWRRGVFHLLPEGSATSPVALEAFKPKLFEALRLFTSRQQACSHALTARNYLVKLMKAENMLNGVQPTTAHACLMACVDAGEILVNQTLPWKTSNRHNATGLVVA